MVVPTDEGLNETAVGRATILVASYEPRDKSISNLFQ